MLEFDAYDTEPEEAHVSTSQVMVYYAKHVLYNEELSPSLDFLSEWILRYPK